MSQRFFKHGAFSVLTGWDRPLQYSFLTVEHPDNEYPVYCNLDDPTLPLGAMTINQVLDKLDELGIEYPDTLRNDLRDDERYDAGNIVFDYGEV